jgi:hypothetical protein
VITSMTRSRRSWSICDHFDGEVAEVVVDIGAFVNSVAEGGPV